MNVVRARWLVAAVAVVGGNAGACAAGRWLNQTYAEEALWVVAEYQGFGVWACLVTLDLAICWWLWRRSTSGRTVFAPALLAMVLSLPLGLELGMGVYYQQVTGELRIAEFLLTRTALDFPSSPDGVCLRAKLDDPWSWQLNEHRVYPRLLPLPLDDARLRQRLLHPGECPR